jgi:ribosomal protein L11 methylase PrmA
VAATRENAVRNGVQLDVRRLDVLQDVLPWVDLVVANIELSAVEALLARRPAARAITSGYPADEAPDAPGWTSISTVELEGWRADLCEPLS